MNKVNNEEISKKPDKKLYDEIAVPESITVSIEDNMLIMKKQGNELKRKLNQMIDIKIDGNKIVLSSKRNRRIEKRLFGTFRSHIKNMIKGLIEGFKYKLQISNVHFPMNVSYNNGELIVKNFLGEKKDRRIKINPDVNVKIEKEIIELTSFDIEKAGTSATNIEKGTRLRNKDRRIFQDGIFIIEKPGRIYL